MAEYSEPKISTFKDITEEIYVEVNSNKIMFCGGGGQHYLVLNKIST